MIFILGGLSNIIRGNKRDWTALYEDGYPFHCSVWVDLEYQKQYSIFFPLKIGLYQKQGAILRLQCFPQIPTLTREYRIGFLLPKAV